MVLNEEEFGEPSQFAAFYSEIFGDDEVPYSGSHDYEPTVIRRIQMARAFATVILATPEFAPKEEEPAPEPAPMP